MTKTQFNVIMRRSDRAVSEQEMSRWENAPHRTVGVTPSLQSSQAINRAALPQRHGLPVCVGRSVKGILQEITFKKLLLEVWGAR